MILRPLFQWRPYRGEGILATVVKKSLAPPREYSGYEYELYHVRKQQNASNRRPVGLRPAGRFLSIFADCHFRQKIRWKRRRSADQGQHRPLTTDRIILLTLHGKGVRRWKLPLMITGGAASLTIFASWYCTMKPLTTSGKGSVSVAGKHPLKRCRFRNWTRYAR